MLGSKPSFCAARVMQLQTVNDFTAYLCVDIANGRVDVNNCWAKY